MKYTTHITIGVLSLLALFVVTGAANAQVCVAPTAGLVSWWPGDGNADDIQDGNDGTLQNGATFAAGFVTSGNGEAFSFDGTNDFVAVSDAANLDITNEITIDAWIKPTAQQLGGIATKFGSPPLSAVSGYGIFYRGDLGGVVDGFIGEGNSFFLVRSSDSIPLNQFSHVAMTYDGSTMTIYINGVPDGTTAATGAIDTNNVQLALGARDSDGVQNGDIIQFFEGFIDEVELYNRALSASEIQAIFNAGSAGKCKEVPFANFTIKEGKVKFHPSTGTRDRFEVEGQLDLGEESNGVDLSAEEVEVTVGTSSIAIPAGLFLPVGSRFEYEGTIYGAKVKMKIKETHSDVFKFKVKVKGLSVTDISHPVEITLRIGDDIGTTMVRLKGTLQLEEEDD